MPTTATVASRSTDDIAFGFRAFADLIEDCTLSGISGTVRADLHVATREDVVSAAAALDAPTVEGAGGLVKTTTTLAGVELTVYTVDRTKLLRRDPAATAVLAERDA